MLSPSSVIPQPRRGGNHFVVNGSDGLAYRLAEQLTQRYGADVVLLLTPEQLAGARGDFADLPRVRVLVVDRVDERALRQADLEHALGLALTVQDDVGNIHIALRARDIVPDLRLVVRMYNSNLGRGIEELLGNAKVLSDAEIAAPALVAIALDEVNAAPVPVAGRTLVVARRQAVVPADVVCGLVDTTSPGAAVDLLPADPARADLVLAEDRETTSVADTVNDVARLVTRRARRWRLRAVVDTVKSLVSRQFRLAVSTTLVVLAVAGFFFARGAHVRSVWDGIYLTAVNAFGGPDLSPELSGRQQLLQLVIALAGLALVPLVTAMVVEGLVNARLAVAQGRLRLPTDGHIVLVGLGNVGTRAMRLLYDRGIPVVAIDVNEQARGVALARELGIPLIIGDASRESTLRSANVQQCRALMTLASNDVINLEAALHGRNLQPQLRVLVRLFDGDLAARVRKTFSIRYTRSVSYLAAPAFAEALMEREVIGTISVERRVLLVAEVVVGAGSALDGARVGDADTAGAVRVIALAEFGEPRPLWRPADNRVLHARDRLTVVASRDGLSGLMAQVAAAGAATV
ncbi:NAD-binding protein [Catellatospora sp. KI3]|uniref:NAD-binding protein n=1 Tax=Catellatospora sp. KI3 TaxID=3041620 RepID=UPI002482C296|nr:NAD(P)-binding protein [Catellatospora sp. KI3]MDI1466270.1 NAD-binding protein [Catellatospora sp. KI3]